MSVKMKSALATHRTVTGQFGGGELTEMKVDMTRHALSNATHKWSFRLVKVQHTMSGASWI